MSHIATLLHISDLHLVQALTEEGRSLWIKGPKTHAYAKIDAFSATIFEIEEINQKQIEAVVVTGDVTTDGSVESVKTALEFIEGKDIYRFTPRRRILRGLGAKAGRRIVIPGNHDRYGGQYRPIPQQVGNSVVEDIFGTQKEYPYVVGCRRDGNQLEPDSSASNVKSPAVIFFVIDSTLVQPDRKDFYNKVARGRIELGECNRIRELAAMVRSTGEILDLDGKPILVDYDNSVRIAVLHHHPVLPGELNEAGVSRFARAVRKLKAGLTLMENANALIDALFDAEIDLVLFGHQHHEYEVVLARTNPRSRLPHSIRFFCCPSTSEYSEPDNGFNLIEVDTDTVRVEYYRWTASKIGTGSFALQRSASYAVTPKVLGKGG
jgi:predicted phosphodiesterase